MFQLLSVTLISLFLISGCGSKPEAATTPAATVAAPEPEIIQSPAKVRINAAPDIELVDLKGQKVSLAAMRGKVVFLDFWATWCPPCVRSVPEVKKLEADYAGKGVEVISLSLDEDEAAVRSFVARNDMKSRVVMAYNSELGNTYEIQSIPKFVLIDKEGRIVKVWKGFHPAMVPEWRASLDRLLQS